MQKINHAILTALAFSAISAYGFFSDTSNKDYASADLKQVSDADLMATAQHLSKGCWGSDPRCLCPVVNIICEIQLRKLDAQKSTLLEELNGIQKNVPSNADRIKVVSTALQKIKDEQELLRSTVWRCNNTKFIPHLNT